MRQFLALKTKTFIQRYFLKLRNKRLVLTLPEFWSEPGADAPERTKACFDSVAAPSVNDLLRSERQAPILDLFCNSNYQKKTFPLEIKTVNFATMETNITLGFWRSAPSGGSNPVNTFFFFFFKGKGSKMHLHTWQHYEVLEPEFWADGGTI